MRTTHARGIVAALTLFAGAGASDSVLAAVQGAGPAPIIQESSQHPDRFGGERSESTWNGLGIGLARLHDDLEEMGIEPGFTWIVDTSSVVSGGVRRRTTTRNLWAANLTLDMDKLAGVGGGRFFAEYQSHAGRDVTDDVGAFQATTNIDAQDSIHAVASVWYEQELDDGAVRLKAGKIDANTEFAWSRFGGRFLLSSGGYSPTILGLPTYPDPSFGLHAFFAPVDWFYAGFGIQDGSGSTGTRTGSLGPSPFFDGDSDRFLIGEAGLEWSAGERASPGRLALGAWRHHGDFERFDGGTENGSSGVYAVLDQEIWSAIPRFKDTPASDPRSLGAFLQIGTADADVSAVDLHIGAGLVWEAPFGTSESHALGLGLSCVHFSDQVPDVDEEAETVFELFYVHHATPWITFVPDIQYVRHPGGMSDVDDALVLTLRIRVDL